MKVRICKDCRAEGRTGPNLNAPYAGPRCYRHHKAHHRKGLEAASESRRVKTYGLAPGDYERLLKAQDGGCGGCGRPRREKGRALAVDHDHECCPGKVTCGACTRGLLCWSCNKFLQHIGDDPAVLERLAEYLRNPPAQRVALQPALL